LNTAVFESFRSPNEGWSASFRHPRATSFAYQLEEVIPALRWAEEAASNGYWAAVMLSYEAAPAFEAVLNVHAGSGFPLACVAIFDRPSYYPTPATNSRKQYQASPWQPGITPDKYHCDFHQVREYIASGDTYQVNYSFPLRCEFAGDSWNWYRDLCGAQQAGYCAYLDLGRYHVLSLSPELFFQRQGNNLLVRPMKGTMPRGRWLEEDEVKANELSASQKDQSENVMIVDLLRNDLGKISVPGSVKVASLFSLERYETLWQMTSTIESRVCPEVTLVDMLRALFPCGSITGAPKVRTMDIIRELEDFPRDLYTGTIGFLRPGGDCIFNVAIRTIVLDTQTSLATFGVGGAITADSTPDGEYGECVLKASFLSRPRPDFRVLETMVLETGQYFLLERHLERIAASCRYFGFVWNDGPARSALEEIRTTHSGGTWKVRLLLTKTGHIDTEAEELQPTTDRKLRVAFASTPIDRSDPFTFHKTTNRSVYENVLKARPDCDDVILWNEDNEIAESTIANIVVELDGKKWTPHRTSGLLAGTFRDELLQSGEISERIIYKDEFCQAPRVWLINSVRRWMPIVVVD
jgi:para-aminobenzoate synthetase/4-amino-4-deoxychorismate lyase